MGDHPTIKRLSAEVVNRIAAGEVIQRPANAIKELLENSLDAGATSITVTLKSGGLKMLQIIDNGHGIEKEDMDIVCERFTTSKLKEFDDLKTISTFGFRGEALASISHVAHLSIVSRTKSTKCAFKARYMDGKLKEPPKPTAGNIGTQITVEDLFYNVPTRQKVFKSASEEHQRVANIITRYAIHNSGISFTLRKSEGESGMSSGGISVKTVQTASVVENISSLYGKNVGNEVVSVTQDDKRLKLKVNGWISNANCSMKKMVFLLFINNRLVDCSSLKSALSAVYQTYLPKGGHPFIYLSLDMAPNNLDVNVHPTKHEVHFLHEDAVIETVQSVVEAKLLKFDSSRKFYTQQLLPTSSKELLPENGDQTTDKEVESKKSKRYDHQLVRTDSKLQKLDGFWQKTHTVKSNLDKNNSLEKRPKEKDPINKNDHGKTISKLPKRRDIRLTSVLQLQENIELAISKDILKLLHNHSFVGCVDPELALIQYSTNLYLVNTTKLSHELFYQIMLLDFGNFGMFTLSEAAPIYELAMLGLASDESGWSPADGNKENLAEYIVTFLSEKADMLKDYFGMEIVDNHLVGIPLLLQDYIPALEGLPMLVLRLSTEVNWECEESCFDTFCREMARFYSVRKKFICQQRPLSRDVENVITTSSNEMHSSKGYTNDDNSTTESANVDGSTSWKWTIEHVIYPAIRKHLRPNSSLNQDGTFMQIASLPDLYKVFERC